MSIQKLKLLKKLYLKNKLSVKSNYFSCFVHYKTGTFLPRKSLDIFKLLRNIDNFDEVIFLLKKSMLKNGFSISKSLVSVVFKI